MHQAVRMYDLEAQRFDKITSQLDKRKTYRNGKKIKSKIDTFHFRFCNCSYNFKKYTKL